MVGEWRVACVDNDLVTCLQGCEIAKNAAIDVLVAVQDQISTLSGLRRKTVPANGKVARDRPSGGRLSIDLIADESYCDDGSLQLDGRDLQPGRW